MVYYNTKKNNLLLKFFSCLLLTIYVFMCLFGLYVCATDSYLISFNSSAFNKDLTLTLPNELKQHSYFIIITSVDSFNWGGTYDLIFYCSDTPFKVDGQSISSSSTLYYIESGTQQINHTPVVDYIPTSFDFTNNTISTGSSFLITSNSSKRTVSYQSNHDVFNVQDGSLVFPNSILKNPEITTPISELENLSANGISVSANSWSEQDLYILFYNTSFNNSINNRTEPLQKFLLVPYLAQNVPSPFYDPTNSTSTNIKYYIPISNFGFPLNIGNTYEIRFATIEGYVDPIDSNNYYNYYNFLGDPYSFTISNNVSQDTINNINQNIATQTEKNYNEELNNSINNQTQSIDNINNSINDPNIDSTFNLPSDNTPDNTQNGINNIFTNIYNSFTRGTASDIVFPIPFTNKNITLQAKYVSNMLSRNGLSWVTNFIRSFWWYFIARFIITDIANKIKKIKSGDIENIQNDNIRSDML